MADIKRGDRVRAPDPDTGDDIVGHFQTLADPDDGLDVPREGDTRVADGAWIRLDDGTSLKVVFGTMRRA
jgi:hypothetical protein